MRDERMAVLDMLNRNVITAKEARELLEVLQKGGCKQESSNKVENIEANEVFDKVNTTFQKVVQKTSDQIEKVQPVVKDITENVKGVTDKVTDKVVEKMDEAEPIIKNMTSKITSFINDIKEEVQEVQAKRAMQKEMFEDLNDLDREEVDLKEVLDIDEIEEFEEFEDLDELDELDEVEETEETEEIEEIEDDLDFDTSSLDNLQAQLNEINDVESFLKSAFGEEAVADYNQELEGQKEDKDN